MPLILAARTLGARLAALRSDQRALALTEFALGLPILITLGCYGVEESNLALTHLRVSQYALTLADNASRVGLPTNLATQQLRELDINDVLQGARLQGSAIKLTTYGRVTVSSLENIQQSYDTAPVQRIHWQRCIGKKAGDGYDSTYGSAKPTDGSTSKPADAGVTVTNGMGDAGSKVVASEGSGLMFVEINYDYQPLFLTKRLLPATKVHYIASFLVRDRREFSQLFNPDPAATAATCDLHNA